MDKTTVEQKSYILADRLGSPIMDCLFFVTETILKKGAMITETIN